MYEYKKQLCKPNGNTLTPNISKRQNVQMFKVKDNRKLDAQQGLITIIQAKSLLQRMQDIDFNYQDNLSDANDEHEDGTDGAWRYPHKGELEGDTEKAFEKNIPTKELYEYYYEKPLMQYKLENVIMQRKPIKLRSDGQTHQYDYALGANYNIDFSANKIAGEPDPVNHPSRVNLTSGCTIPKWGIMRSGKMVKIAPNGKRAQHFSIADRLYPNTRGNTWTWHHLDTPYQMVLVDSAVHCPGFGGFFHWGGMKFWP